MEPDAAHHHCLPSGTLRRRSNNNGFGDSRRTTQLALQLPLLVLCFLSTVDCASNSKRPNPLLLISVDGLRWDYMSKLPMKHLEALAAQGVYGKRLKGVFPTVTYPNHWSIVTGKTPAKHGIVANSFYDPSYNSTFKMSSTEEMWWNTTLPIWATAAQQNRSVSAYAWPGSNTVIRGYTPKHVMRLNRTIPQTDLIDTALTWLQNDETDMAAVYFHEPDSTAHRTGSESNATFEMLKAVDENIDYLRKEVENRGLQRRLNIVLLSDHGMIDVTASRIIRLTEWINQSDVTFVSTGAFSHIFPKEGNEQKIYDALVNVHPHIKVYRRAEIPSNFLYRENARIAPIFAIADEGWYIALNDSVTTIGVHGYGNNLESMKSTFVALGPDFKTGVNVPEVSSLDVYPLMCHLLDISPEQHDGDFQRVSCMLKGYPACLSGSPLTGYNAWLIAAATALTLACR